MSIKERVDSIKRRIAEEGGDAAKPAASPPTEGKKSKSTYQEEIEKFQRQSQKEKDRFWSE